MHFEEDSEDELPPGWEERVRHKNFTKNTYFTYIKDITLNRPQSRQKHSKRICIYMTIT